MKKILLIFTTTLILSAVSAQDTVHTTQPPVNYYFDFWQNHQLGDTVFCNSRVIYSPQHYTGVAMTTKDTLTIYGLAFGAVIKYADSCFTTWEWDSVNQWFHGSDPDGYYDGNGVWHLIGDSALDETYMDFYVIQADTSVRTVSDTVRLHMMYDTVAYYVDQEFVHTFYPYETCEIIPVYEMYFKHPSSVCNKFYIGGINHSAKECTHGNQMYPEIMGRRWSDFDEQLLSTEVTVWNNSDVSEGDAPWQWFFPILTPENSSDTNIIVPGDSTQTSIRTNTWERYVSLQPNPASDEATVLSSFGIDEVEVFDMAGSRVLLQEASGLAAKLDVMALPRGSYIVRIHTPMGTTSRKLVVQ